jgi:hypothetical protein
VDAARDQVAPMLALADVNSEPSLHPLQGFRFNEGNLAGIKRRVVAGAQKVTIAGQPASGQGLHFADPLHPGACLRGNEDGLKKGFAHVAA